MARAARGGVERSAVAGRGRVERQRLHGIDEVGEAGDVRAQAATVEHVREERRRGALRRKQPARDAVAQLAMGRLGIEGQRGQRPRDLDREALALVGAHRGQALPAGAPVGDADGVRGPERERHVPQVLDRRQLRQQALRDRARRVTRHHLRGRGLVLLREPDERDRGVAAAGTLGHDRAVRRAPQAEHEALLLRPVHPRQAGEGERAQAVEEVGTRRGGGGEGNGRRRGHVCSWNVLGGITQDRGTWPLPPSVMRVANRILRSTHGDMWRT